MDTKVARTQVPLGRTNHTIVTYNDKLYLSVSLISSFPHIAHKESDSVAPMVYSGSMTFGRMTHEATHGYSWIA